MSVGRRDGRFRAILEGPWILTCEVVALAADNFVITRDHPPLLFIDPGGAARDVLLPTPEPGLTYVIVNTADAAETITLRNAGDTASYGTIAQNARAMVVSDGTSFYLV